MIEEVEKTSALYIPPSFRLYQPELSNALNHKIFSKLRLSERTFSNLMPLLISDEAPHAVMMWLLNGDNWQKAIIDMFKAHALTQNIDQAGSSVEKLGVFGLFADFRQDLRTRKPILDSKNEVAIVKSQASFSQAVARLMKHVAEVDYFASLDIHSFIAMQHFTDEGIDTVNLTAAFLMADEIKNKNLIKGDMETMVCGIDMGNLALVKALSQYLDLPIAIIRKWREAIMGGAQSKTHHELVFGNVKNKRIILVDDMISSGGTIEQTVNELLKHGVKEIIICATHAVLSGNDYYRNIQKVLALKEVKLVMTTSSIPLQRPSGEEKDRPYVGKKELEILDISNLIDWILEILLNSQNFDEAKKRLQKHVLELEDPYIIYKEITGQKIEKPKDVAIYQRGGTTIPLP